MVGLQATVFKNKLGPQLNGIVNYETWVPSEKMHGTGRRVLQKVPGACRRRRRRSARLLSRRLGLRLHQMLGDAIKGTNSIDDNKIADYIRGHSFKTIMGD